MKTKAILWDNDGVLVDTEELYFQANQRVLASVDIELTRELFIEINLKRGESAIGLAREKGLEETQVEGLFEERGKIYTGLLEAGVEVVPGVRETLQQLYGKLAMAVVTTCHGETRARRPRA